MRQARGKCGGRGGLNPYPTKNEQTVSLRVPSIEAGGKKRMVVDTLQGNVCDATKDYFVIKDHGKNTRTTNI